MAGTPLAATGDPGVGEERNGVIVLALDVGAKRIGVAVSDELELLASPRAMIRRQSTEQALTAIERVVRESGAAKVVVGLPISFDGQLHAQARTIQAFAERLRKRLTVSLEYADETLSSVRAEEQLRAAGVRPERIRERLDSAAAAVILQDYLDQRRDAERKARLAEQAAKAQTALGHADARAGSNADMNTDHTDDTGHTDHAPDVTEEMRQP